MLNKIKELFQKKKPQYHYEVIKVRGEVLPTFLSADLQRTNLDTNSQDLIRISVALPDKIRPKLTGCYAGDSEDIEFIHKWVIHQYRLDNG